MLIFNHPAGTGIFVDVECYPNYFLVGVKIAGLEEFYFYELFNDEHSGLTYDELLQALFHFQIIGFNYLKYDNLMVHALCDGLDCRELKNFSNKIIQEQMQAYSAFELLSFKEPMKFNIIDLIDVAPLKASLKQYGARLHVEEIEELPIDHNKYLTLKETFIIKNYNKKDLRVTEVLYIELFPYIELRCKMSEKYKVDLRSKSDAQIAEHVICAEIERLTGRKVLKPNRIPEFVNFKVPEWAEFKTPVLQKLAKMLGKLDFKINPHTGKVIAPTALRQFNLVLGGAVYTFGIGGLHSTESCSAHISDDDLKIVDIDYGSFYPQTILNQQLYPVHIGPLFLNAYGGIVEVRLSDKNKAATLKELGDPTWQTYQMNSDGLKIVINGGFGKFGNRYSALYSPDLMLQVTLSGQLAILKLIEHALDLGLGIVSANTDGVVIKHRKEEAHKLEELITYQSRLIGAVLEKTEYEAIYARDVNNYFAVKKADKKQPSSKFLEDRQGVKVKGTWAERGSALNSMLSTNPTQLIVSDAVINFLVDKKPPIETLKECQDFGRFLHVRAAQYGATFKGEYVGKVLRFYKSKTSSKNLNCAKSGNKIANSDFCRLAQNLPKKMPEDLDFQHYYDEIVKTLYEIGAIEKHKQRQVF